MSRSSVSWYPAAPAIALPAGWMLVADILRRSDGRVLSCSAAPMGEGALSAAVRQVVSGTVHLPEEGPGSDLRAAVADTAASARRAGDALGAEGTYDEAPDATVVVDSPRDIVGPDPPDLSKITYLTQTTLAVDETRATIAALKERSPQARGPGSEDIYSATTNRQHALQAVTAQADLVLVLGSENSSNSVRLVELARKAGTPAHLIEDRSRIRPDWLRDAATAGLSAGASGPPALVQDTLSAPAGLGPLTVREQITTTEDTYFATPTAVRKNR
ncbi:4-hydroxy-3-methylbut-2-enyl diphosphate reductase [Streptomyces sp. NPDC005953]|uniref:4-hydroxy-3-methylbut-2-enyl diphosphate reductase n=1 Tax=Streptomyces sp. NPDC005953 TaxID=3156719 RepID=UPI0033D84763